jgi:hypothetical protein
VLALIPQLNLHRRPTMPKTEVNRMFNKVVRIKRRAVRMHKTRRIRSKRAKRRRRFLQMHSIKLILVVQNPRNRRRRSRMPRIPKGQTPPRRIRPSKSLSYSTKVRSWLTLSIPRTRRKSLTIPRQVPCRSRIKCKQKRARRWTSNRSLISKRLRK